MVKSVGLCFPKPQKWRPQMSFFCFLSIAQIYSVHFPRGVKLKSENFDFFHKKDLLKPINELCCVTLRGVSTLLSTCMCSLVSYDFLVRGCNLNLWTQYSSNSDLTVRLISVRWHHNKMNAFTELGNLNLAWNSRPSRQQWKLPQR